MQKKAILAGKVTGRGIISVYKLQYTLKISSLPVNSEVATMETVLQNNDLLSHRVHRHEPPVTAQPIKILYQNSDIVAVDKPPSIPVRTLREHSEDTTYTEICTDLSGIY